MDFAHTINKLVILRIFRGKILRSGGEIDQSACWGLERSPAIVDAPILISKSDNYCWLSILDYIFKISEKTLQSSKDKSSLSSQITLFSMRVISHPTRLSSSLLALWLAGLSYGMGWT
jgi:hypothetical protein